MTPSGLNVIRATRKPFYVNAFRVTADNMPAAAKRCNGVILATTPEEGLKHYIKVEVEGARNERQTRAYAGDWILEASSGKYKVYTNRAWSNSFDEVGDLPCGATSTTMDHEPCVLNQRHVETMVGCRSFNDYKHLEKHHVSPLVELVTD